MPGETLSHFKDRPRTRAAWWSMGLGLSALLAVLGTGVLFDVDGSWGKLNLGPAVVLVLGIAALVTGATAYRRGERSFILWIGLVPGLLFGLALIAELTVME